MHSHVFSFYIFVCIFFKCSVFGVLVKNAEISTKPSVQVEDLPWRSYIEYQPKADDEDFRKTSPVERRNSEYDSPTTLCPPGKTGQFHYPPDCKRFINCWKGRGSIQVCAPGTLFNPETRECDFPGKVKCHGDFDSSEDQRPMPTRERYVRFPNQRPSIAYNPRIARNQINEESRPDSIPAKPYPGRPPYFGPSHLKPPTRPSNKPSQGRDERPKCSLGATGLYPHPWDCKKFLKCWNGNTYIENCGPGTYFNPLISSCDHPSNVDCRHEQERAPGETEFIDVDPQIPEESVIQEQYQKTGENQITTKKDSNAHESEKEVKEDDYQEVVSPSTPKTEAEDLEPSLHKTRANLTSRTPKVINTGSQGQYQVPFGSEPASHLTPPKYDIYGNLIPTGNGKQGLLGVQPSPVKGGHHYNANVPSLQNQDRFNSSFATLHPNHFFLTNYPPQGPYSQIQVGSPKQYNGYLLSTKTAPHNPNHPVHQLHPLHPLNPMHPHRPMYLHHNHPPNMPPMWLQPPPPQQHHVFHYAPNHPIHLNTPFYIPQTAYSRPFSLHFPHSRPAGFPPSFGAQNNKPQTPNYNSGMPSVPSGSFPQTPSGNSINYWYQPAYFPSGLPQETNHSEENKPGYGPQDKNTKPQPQHPGNSYLNPQNQHSYNPQYQPISNNLLPVNQPQRPEGSSLNPQHQSGATQSNVQPGSLSLNPQHQYIYPYYPQYQPNPNNLSPGGYFKQPENPNYKPQGSQNNKENPHKEPTSTNVDPQNQFVPPYNPQYQSGQHSIYPSYPQRPVNPQSQGSQNLNGNINLQPQPYPSTDPKPSTTSPNPQNQFVSPYIPQFQSGQNNLYPSNYPQRPASSNFNPQTQSGVNYGPQTNPQPGSYHLPQTSQKPSVSNVNPETQPGSVHNPNYQPAYHPQYHPNVPGQQNPNAQVQQNYYPGGSYVNQQGQLPVPDPFLPNYDNSPYESTEKGQVQIPDPFISGGNYNKNNIDREDDNQGNKKYPVHPGKSENAYPTNENGYYTTSTYSKEPSESGVSSNYYKQTATFPPFPGHTESSGIKSGSSGIKGIKTDRPKENYLGKIDVRTGDESNAEIISTTKAPKDADKIVFENTKKPPRESGDDDLEEDAEYATKKTIKSELDFDAEEIEKPKKIIRKPYVKVKQTPPNGQVVRLRNGASHLDGYLEMKDPDSKWGLVCDDTGGWQIAEATVACRELGFLRGAELSWQGYPIKSDAESLHVAVKKVNCTGSESSLSECKIDHSKQKECNVARNAVGLRCYDNLASHCQPGEILYNQHCYKLHGKENPDDPDIKTSEASEECKKHGGKLVDITSQYENDFISEWLIKKHPEVTSVATGGIGISVLGRPMWLWEGTNDPMVFERWWSGWSGKENIPKGSINGPLCIVLKKTFSCSESDDEEQRIVESNKDDETCSADYFFWDTEDCEKLRTSVFICERPMDDIGCVVGSGEGYTGTANTTASGRPCLPWDHPKVVEGLARRVTVQERSSRLVGHNYCRNLGNPDRHPWCFVEGMGNSEYCAIPQCWDSVSGYTRFSGLWSSCDQNHFECQPGECIKKTWVCDGQKDCSNGRDEEMCKVFLQEFKAAKDKKMKRTGNEKWPNTNENMCAKLCLENKNFKCRSFSYNVREKYCLLSDTNIGLSGQVVSEKGWTYHERSTESLHCTLENGLFGCQNGKCINISNVCDGKKNCEDGSDEKDCGRIGYGIRLAGSKEKHKGRVEVRILGKWGQICDDMFDLRDANVICRELGFKLGAAEFLQHSHFPVNNTLFLIDDLDCLGNETSVKECQFPGWGKHNCGSEESVGIVCRIPGVECPEGEWQCRKSKECISTSYLCDNAYDCDDKTDEDKTMCTSPTQIRLAGGPNATAGRLEIRHFDIWGTVCDDDFNVEAADVVCRLLGYYGPSVVKKNAFFGPGKGPIWLDDVLCTGNETSLEECAFGDKNVMWGNSNCKHDEDVSVICSTKDFKEKKSAVTPIASSSSNDNVITNEEKLRQVLISECSGIPQKKLQKTRYKYERVVGGRDVTREEIPWQASVRVRYGQKRSVHWCGAIIISPYHVLTAGHCLRDYGKSSYFIRVGDFDTNVQDPYEEDFKIDHLYMHPEFDKKTKLNNDIGLVKIEGEIRFGDQVKPACLAPSVNVYQPGTNCSISGWGSVSAENAGYARTLKRAFVPILEPTVCRAPFVYGDDLSDGMFCAGHLDGGVDSCQGDSGGPLMCQHEDRDYLFGITSWGHGCGRANKPGVYTNVAFYMEWIQEKIQSSLT